MDLSIIIVNWNTRELLARCLQSVGSGFEFRVARSAGQSATCNPQPVTYEVFVVDNASTDGSAQMVRERFPWVRLTANSENVGFARANNQAIRKSKGRYVLLLNPDTEVHPGALETLTRFMDTRTKAGAAGARLLNPDGTLQAWCYPAPTLSREFWRLFYLDVFWPYGRYDMATWDLSTPREVDMVPGACLILRSEALNQVGLLDEDYFMYSEEVDLCYRIRQCGWKVYWVPQAMVMHYGGQSTRQVPVAMFLRLHQGKILYFRKNYGQLTAQAYKLILLVAALTRLLLTPLAWLERLPKRHQHLVRASHYRRLLRALPKM